MHPDSPNIKLDYEPFYSGPCGVTLLLDEVSGAYERAQLGLRRARDGETIALGELQMMSTSG